MSTRNLYLVFIVLLLWLLCGHSLERDLHHDICIIVSGFGTVDRIGPGGMNIYQCHSLAPADFTLAVWPQQRVCSDEQAACGLLGDSTCQNKSPRTNYFLFKCKLYYILSNYVIIIWFIERFHLNYSCKVASLLYTNEHYRNGCWTPLLLWRPSPDMVVRSVPLFKARNLMCVPRSLTLPSSGNVIMFRNNRPYWASRNLAYYKDVVEALGYKTNTQNTTRIMRRKTGFPSLVYVTRILYVGFCMR